MVNRVSISRRDRTAIASSIALHLCLLAALLANTRPAPPVDDPEERIVLATLTRIEHRPVPVVARPHPRVVLDVPARKTVPLPAVNVAVTTAHATRAQIVAPERRYTAPRMIAAATAPVAVEQPDVAPRPTPPPTPTASPPPTAAPTAPPQREDGIGNFGETYPASVDPAARAALVAGLGASFDVRVTVDENGHPTAVEFIRAPADAALREELRSRLLGARFIPAACNGLRCGGTVVLRN